MAESLILSSNSTRETRYAEILPQLKAVIEAESDLVANLANIAAILKEAFGFLWVGFYRRHGSELILGPFQGPLACTRIALGRGVCGTAAQEKRTLIVPDVHQFPDHIACSSLSQSEIVVPLVQQGRCVLVLDVDSEKLADFSETDGHYLEAIMALVGQVHPAITS